MTRTTDTDHAAKARGAPARTVTPSRARRAKAVRGRPRTAWRDVARRRVEPAHDASPRDLADATDAGWDDGVLDDGFDQADVHASAYVDRLSAHLRRSSSTTEDDWPLR